MISTPTASIPIPLWVWPAAAFAIMFGVNALPHTLMGLTVHWFPTPFSGGPGTLSSPMVNTLWGLSNVIAAWTLCRILRSWLEQPSVQWFMTITGFAFAIFLTWAIGSVPLPPQPS